MPKILDIEERKEIGPYLEARGLLKQYLKAKRYLLEGRVLQVRLKERKPSGSGIWYFRINQQFRAYGTFDNVGNLIIFHIDNHQ